MKFTCEKYLLSLAVATAGRAAASKSPIPAMEGLLIEAGHNVRVTGYDLKKGIYTTFEADVSAPGSVVINAKLFGDIVRKLPDGIVSVCSDENNAVNIACGNADYNISGIGRFPRPSVARLLQQSLPAAGHDGAHDRRDELRHLHERVPPGVHRRAHRGR